MDIVITYVNGNDKSWIDDFHRYVSPSGLNKQKARYRDLGTLKFLLRGIDKYGSDINNIFLVVSNLSQVPSWVNQSKIKVVTHSQFIPIEFLPTFNSTAIEMFLHRIPGLSDHFVYFNDDIIPTNYINEDSFFSQNHVKLRYRKFKIKTRNNLNLFKFHCINSSKLVFGSDDTYYSFYHTVSPMIKSINEELFNNNYTKIKRSISRVRSDFNLNQYVYLNNYINLGLVDSPDYKVSYIRLNIDNLKKLSELINDSHLTCLNDYTDESTSNSTLMKVETTAYLTKLFPNKCNFEI